VSFTAGVPRGAVDIRAPTGGGKRVIAPLPLPPKVIYLSVILLIKTQVESVTWRLMKKIKKSIILLRCRSKVSHGDSTLIEEIQRKKKKNLNPLFYIKDLGRLRFNSLKLVIYLSQIILRHRVNME
jgi:hypothetical protein